MNKAFDSPLSLTVGGTTVTITDLDGMRMLLASTDWPMRGPAHRDALETCLKVEDGHRSAADAREALARAVAEAGGAVSG